MPSFPEHFVKSLALLKAKGPAEDAWREIETRHGEPHRHFHTLDYLAFRLDLLATTEHDTAHLRLALYYHDIVYDPCGDNNELESARFATDQLTAVGVREKDTSTIYDLIRVTDPQPGPIPTNGDLFSDLSISFLGARPEQYQSFAEARRKELSWLPDSKYKRSRLSEIMTLLDRPAIFQTSEFQDRFGAPARKNLIKEISQLHG